MTLLELAVVLLILIALAGLLVPYVQHTGSGAQCVATDATLGAIRDTILGTGGQPGYLSDMGGYPRHPVVTSETTRPYNLHYLVQDWNANFEPSPTACLKDSPDAAGCVHLPKFNPLTQRGWRGPYLSNTSVCDILIRKYSAPSDPNRAQYSPLYTVCKIGGTEENSADKYFYSNIAVALDSFSVMGQNGKEGLGMPIQLFKDAQGKFYLVSAGPDNMTYLSNGVDPQTNLRWDDRVLYLNGSDRWGNQPCQ